MRRVPVGSGILIVDRVTSPEEHRVTDLPEQDLLTTIAEVSAAFVGFSMVVGLLRSAPSNRTRVLSIRDVAETSLVIVGAPLAPALIHGFGLPADVAYRFPSLVLSVAWIAMTLVAINRFTRAGVFGALPGVLWFGPLSQIVAHPLLWWNVLSPDSLSGPRYTVVLVIFLAFAGLSFVVATFHERDE